MPDSPRFICPVCEAGFETIGELDEHMRVHPIGGTYRLRMWLSGHLVVLGVKVMPRGALRRDLTRTLGAWGRRLSAAIGESSR